METSVLLWHGAAAAQDGGEKKVDGFDSYFLERKGRAVSFCLFFPVSLKQSNIYF